MSNLCALTKAYVETFDHIVQLIHSPTNDVVNPLNKVGSLAEDMLTDVKRQLFEVNNIRALNIVADARRSLLGARLNVFKFLQEGEGRWANLADADYNDALAALDKLLEGGVEASRAQSVPTDLACGWRAAEFAAVRSLERLMTSVFLPSRTKST